MMRNSYLSQKTNLSCLLIIRSLMTLIMVFSLAGCLGGGADGGFSSLIGGNLSDVDELTIISSSPSANTVTVDIGDTETFSILAQTPPPASVSYFISVNGTTVSNTNSYVLTGASSSSLPTSVGIGNHTVTATATDGTATKSRSWTVKVNGPPALTNGYSTSPKVAIGSTLNLTVTGTDPNSDAITYTWEVNGATSAYLVGSGNTAVLTANSSLISGTAGPVTITVTGEDDSGATGSTSFRVEINAFHQSCNELAQYEMCTYVGTPFLGDGYDPMDSTYSSLIKLSPIALAVDARNDNILIADWVNNLVWYWNRTSSAVNFLQFSGADAIAANTIKVIGGTGEAATESGDLSLNVGINGPRGLYYDDSRNRLYISEWNAGRIKVVESTGITSYYLGVGGAHTDGALATAHACSNPAGMSFYNNNLYVACYGSHRVKEWGINVANLSTSTVNTIYGGSAGDASNFRNDRSAMEVSGTWGASTEDGAAYAACASNCSYRRPYDVHVDSTGLYVTHQSDHYVRYCNYNGSGAVTMFGVTIGVNFCRSILGTGAASFGAGGGNPRSTAFQEPRSIVVDNGKILVTSIVNSSDRIALLNATGGNIPIGSYGVAINNNTFDNITSTTAGYSEGATALTKQLNEPYDIIVEPDTSYTNSYLVADYGNRRLRRFNYGSNITTSLVGSGRLRDDNIGNTGLASEFFMNNPSGILYDSQSTEQALYVVDSNNDRIIKIDKYGNVTSPVGGTVNAPGAVNGAQSPGSIIYNSDATILTGIAFFNDFSMVINNAVYSHLQVWNRSGSTKSYLNATSTGNNKINQLGGNYSLADNGTSTNYDDDANAMLVSLYNPAGVAISENQVTPSDKEVFVADQYRHCIRRINSDGSMDTVIGICKNGSQPNNIVPTQTEGGGGSSGDSISSLLTEFLYLPVGLHIHYPSSADATAGGGTPASLNGKGNLIIADYNDQNLSGNNYGNRVRYWNRSGTSIQFAGVTIPDGTVQTIACNAGSTNTTENIFATGSQCSRPTSFAMNDDYLCFSQETKHNIRCIHLQGANEGRIFTVAGSLQSVTSGISGVPFNDANEGTAATAQKLSSPTGLTFDSTGDLYITDRGNHLVKKVKLSP